MKAFCPHGALVILVKHHSTCAHVCAYCSYTNWTHDCIIWKTFCQRKLKFSYLALYWTTCTQLFFSFFSAACKTNVLNPSFSRSAHGVQSLRSSSGQHHLPQQVTDWRWALLSPCHADEWQHYNQVCFRTRSKVAEVVIVHSKAGPNYHIRDCWWARWKLAKCLQEPC